MQFLKKYRSDIFILAGLAVVYFAIRLANLTILPIFTDEAIYLRWSQVMTTDASLRFLPLVDGKPPLFMWLVTVAMKILKGVDPLLVGRLVSIGAGFLGITGIYFTAYQLFQNKKISLLSAICYLLSPFTFFYDRFAMADSLLAAIGIWSFGLTVMLVKSGRLDVAMILGFVIGLGRLTKTPAIFFVLLLPITAILFNWRNLKGWTLLLLSAGISEMIYSVLRLFPLFNMIAQKNLEFTVAFPRFLSNPLEFFWRNFPMLLSWEFWYLTPLVSIVVLIGFFFGLKKHPRESLLLVSCFLIHLVAMSFFNKVIYPRFLLTFTPMLLILAAYGLNNLKYYFYPFIFVFPAIINLLLIINPVKAPLLQADRDQYIDGWPAGNGMIEVREYLKNKSGVIATEGTFGLMPYALELYQKDYHDMQIKSYWPLPEKTVPGTDYLFMYQRQSEPDGWKLQELMRFKQGNSNDYLRLYKVLN